ncbi:hypothetical protein Tco_0500456 [Tanacetum coccineum]
MIYLMVLADAAESVRDAIGFEYCLASSSGWTKSPVLWAEIRESSLTGLELVQEMTDKVVLVKEKPKRREIVKRAMLIIGKGKLAPRYVGPFEILERIGLVAYRLRLPEELSSVHDTFHVSNLKKCLADANLHVPLDEIKVDKTLRFVEEPVEIMDREIKKLKRRKIAPVKVRWNSKRGPEFTWEYEDHMRIKLAMPLEMAKSSFYVISGLLAGVHDLFSGRNCFLVRRITCGYPWLELEGKRFGIQQDEIKKLDVIVGMDWLSKRKFMIVCYENVVRIPLEGDEILRLSNLKKCLADANFHVPLDEIKVDKILRFVEEPVEIMDREIKKLKRRKIALVKVKWNLKRGPEFTWEHEDQMRIKYPQLFVDRVVEPTS